MHFVDLGAQLARVRSEVDVAMASVLNHGQYVMGPEIKRMEEVLASYVGVKECIAVASGTTALQVALMSLNVGPGDEVITTPFSFFGTVEVILLLGATPVFVDINPKTYNLDPLLLEAAITSRTKAILPVSLYGQCADYDVINAIAATHKLPVVEDGAQSFGAEYKNQKSLGLTTISCTSFFPSKPLGCYGDGGACFTNDENLAHLMRSIVSHGQENRYQHFRLGINGRMDSLQAAIVLVKFEKLFLQEVESRQEIARQYGLALSEFVKAPYVEAYNKSVFGQYTIEVDDRTCVQQQLKEQGIPTAVHYPKPLHQQPALGPEFHSQKFPCAERAASRVMSLPFHPYMKSEEIRKVAEAVKVALSVMV